MEKIKFTLEKRTVQLLYVMFIATYVAISFIVTGVFFGKVSFNHVLYVVNIIIILFLIRQNYNPVFEQVKSGVKRKQLIVLASVIVLIMFLAFVLINIHGELGGAQHRFPVK